MLAHPGGYQGQRKHHRSQLNGGHTLDFRLVWLFGFVLGDIFPLNMPPKKTPVKKPNVATADKDTGEEASLLGAQLDEVSSHLTRVTLQCHIYCLVTH